MASIRFPMQEDVRNGAEQRWLRKKVIRSVVLDDAENDSTWRLVEQGSMSFATQRCKVGTRSVRLTSPTLSSKEFQTEAPGRPHGKSSLLRVVDGEDWSSYNRVSFWVYPTLPGFRVVSMSVRLHNDGEKKVPDKYEREGLHYVIVKPDQWNQVVWEIEHLSRDRVTGLELAYRLQGSDQGAAKEVVFDFDLIELQQVEPDHFEGWKVAPGRVAFSHSGYATGAEKIAYASSFGKVTNFEVVSEETEEVRYRGDVESVTSPTGAYQRMDFTSLASPGRYRIRIGGFETRSFAVGDHVWRSSLWKTINFFFTERCGFEVPGIHGVCHRDWRVAHDGKEIVTNGGWHDAGDLSQGLVNTAEAVYAMLAVAERLREEEPELAERTIEEALWGLDWVLKTRFGDGYRTVWSTMDLWTDNVIGTFDDEICEATNDPFANFAAATAEALAANVLKERGPILAAYCLKVAREDVAFALARREGFDVQTASEGILALAELYRLEGLPEELEQAVELSRYVMDCQQREIPQWDVPMTGFFYRKPDRALILHYEHRGHEQAPIVAMQALMELAPEHPLWMEWYATVALHAEYLKQGASFTEPYAMLPSSIYKLDESDKPDFREQVQQGIRLAEGIYLRRFPVWFAFRGNSGTVLTQAKALSAAAHVRGDLEALELANKQLYWEVGFNPFGQSLMYGEGYDYTPQYSAMSGNLVGSLPVGIQTRENRDEPYWPMQNCYNYKETWVHPSSRWLWLMADLYGTARLEGTLPAGASELRLEHESTGKVFVFKPKDLARTVSAAVTPGSYRIRAGKTAARLVLLPGRTYPLDFGRLLDMQVRAEQDAEGAIRIRVTVRGEGRAEVRLKAHNLDVSGTLLRTAECVDGWAEFEWQARRSRANHAWIAVIVPNGIDAAGAECRG